MEQTVAAQRYKSKDFLFIETNIAATEVATSFCSELSRPVRHFGRRHAREGHTYTSQTMPPSPTAHRSSKKGTSVLLVSAARSRRPGQTAHQDTSSNITASLLLALPGELRTAIYIATLEHSQGHAILYTCRQIYMEAQPVLYNRPIHLASQRKLFSWLEQGKGQDFRRVRSLALCLTDVDLAPLFDPMPSRQGSSMSAWDLYQHELVLLDDALCSLPGLEHLVVLPPDKHKSTFVKSMYLCFLGRIVVRCPKLKQLTLHDHDSILQKVPELSKLAKVVFDKSSSLSSTSQFCSDNKWPSKPKKEEMELKMETSDEEC